MATQLDIYRTQQKHSLADKWCPDHKSPTHRHTSSNQKEKTKPLLSLCGLVVPDGLGPVQEL